jgi:hypothetical protein
MLSLVWLALEPTQDSPTGITVTADPASRGVVQAEQRRRPRSGSGMSTNHNVGRPSDCTPEAPDRDEVATSGQNNGSPRHMIDRRLNGGVVVLRGPVTNPPLRRHPFGEDG